MALYDGRVKKKVWFLLRVVIIRFIIWILEKILDFKYLEKTKDERWLNLTPSCLGGGRGGKGESWFCHGLETGVGCKLQLYLFLSGLSLELGQVTFLAGAYLCQFVWNNWEFSYFLWMGCIGLSQVTPRHYLLSALPDSLLVPIYTHWYPCILWLERGIMIVKCLVQEQRPS